MREKEGLEDLSLFIALIYGGYWNEANLAHRAPLNDLNFLRQLETYENDKLKNAALTAMKRHLWYLSEYLIPLAFFDPRVSNSTKQVMVNNMVIIPENKKVLKRSMVRISRRTLSWNCMPQGAPPSSSTSF